MDTVNVKMPEDQKKLAEKLSEKHHYPSLSEYVREAVRDKIKRELPLSQNVQDRIDEARKTPDEEYLSKEEVEEDLGL